MLTKNQFALLSYIAARPAGEPALSQRAIAQGTGKALGTVNGLVKELSAMGCLDGANRITDAGLAALAPYRVDNAVIMAAGMSSRFAPLSYEKPKALLKVKGEVLIEREIRQLQAAGIEEILLRSWNSLAILPERLDCDSYHFLDGDPQAVNSYRHDYLCCYEWAEFRLE